MTTTTVTFEKSIRYDRETGDFRATLDGNYIGHFASYYEAECALDQVAYDLLMDGQCATATELDGGSEPDAMVADHAVVAPANISEPAATTDRQGNTAYAVVVTYQSMPLRYRLHNEWTYGVDCRGAFADSAPMWYGTDMDALNLPAETITALRALWESLFTPSPDAPITPARHWSHDLPAYGTDNCAGCGGTVPCGCDDNYGDVQGNRWIVCGAPGDGPCYCDTMVRTCDCPDAGPAPILAPALLDEADAALHLSDAAELAAEISTQDGLPLAEARAIAAEHVARLMRPARPAVAVEPLVVLRVDELEAVVVDGGSVYVALDDDDNATIVADGVLLGVSRDELRRLVQVLGHPQVRRWLDSHTA